MKTAWILIFFSLIIHHGIAQNNTGISRYAEATLAGGSFQGNLTLSYFRNWQFGASRKLGIGLGGRFTSYVGQNQYYITAPAKATSGSTSPTILFQDNINANIDTLLVKSPQVNALNLFINFDYALSKKLLIGFNIDLIGFSFGGERQGNYINGTSGKITNASPTPFNLLLISDNDLGTLNSEFSLKYFFREPWGLKAGAQFLFTEYTTTSAVQTYPEPNDRFRNKSLMFSLGAFYKFK